MKRKQFNLIARLSPTTALFRALDVSYPHVPDLEKVEAAIELGAKLHKKNSAGKTALVVCAEKFAGLMKNEESLPLIRAIEGYGNLVEGDFSKKADVFFAAAQKLVAAGANQQGAIEAVVSKSSLKSVQKFLNILKNPAAAPEAYPSIH